MARNKGQFPFSANFEVKNAAAIDPRVAVDTKAELINKETWPYDGNTIYLYDGLLVSVKDEKSIYMLVDRTKALASDYSGWQRVDVNAGKHIQNIEGKQPLTIKFDGGSTEGTNQFTYNVESAKNVNITPENINASRETHTHPTSISSNATTNLSVTAGGTTDTINDLYATYADQLRTTRTINGTSFNGTANITTANWGTARSIGIVNSDGTGTAVTTSVNGSANVNLKLPATIKASLTGNASTATKLATARTISLSGGAKGSVSFNGSADVTIPVTITDNSHNHTISNISNLNSGWDSLLSNAPSAYITRWPSISEVTNKQNLVIKLNGGSTEGTNQFTFNGVTSKSVNITPGTIGAQAAGNYMTTDTAQSITGAKTSIGNPWSVRMSVDTSNAIAGLMWKNTSGSNIAGLTYHNTAKRIFINANTPEVTDIWSDAVGKYSLRIGWNELTYNNYPILRSDNIGSYALTPSNYTSTLDSRYVNVSGDTMTGPLTITTSSDDILIFNDPDGEKYFRIKAKANGTDWGGLVLDGRSSVQNLYLGTTTDGYKVWHSGNDGAGSGLDADLLDGTHKSGLFTALSSTSSTNLSVTIGGTTKSIADLYANYATSAGSVAWGNVTGKPSWIGSSKPSYSWSEISGKPSTFAPSSHSHAWLNGWGDTRSVVETPNSYNGRFEVVGIKNSSTYGISSGTYVQVLGFRGWTDSSGGRAHELAFADNGRIYHRDGSTTSWDSWDTVAYLSDIPSLSGYATQSWVQSQGYLTSAPSYSVATASKDGLVRIGFPESGKNYPVELNSNHQMYVNVPWTDTNTTYSNATTSTAGLMSAADKTKLNNTPTFSYSNGVLTITT